MERSAEVRICLETFHAMSGTDLAREGTSYVLEVLDLWWTTQKGYLRVRPFFFSKEVGMHLTKEVVLYERLDSNWRETMQVASPVNLMCDLG